MRTSFAILGQKYLFLMMVSVFSTPWKTCIATPYPYYMNKESALFWTSKLLDFQTKSNTANFFMDLFNVFDRKIFKYNTIHVYSPTSAGKNFIWIVLIVMLLCLTNLTFVKVQVLLIP